MDFWTQTMALIGVTYAGGYLAKALFWLDEPRPRKKRR